MATPASLFHVRSARSQSEAAAIDRPDDNSDTQSVATATEHSQPRRSLARATDPVEFDALVPPPGVVNIIGAQQVWVGKNYVGRSVVMWVDLISVHVIIGDTVVKTILSKLTTTDLERLTRRGTRPGRSSPAAAAVDLSVTVARPRALEIDRTASRDGIVVIRGHNLALGVATAGMRVTLRIDGNLIHATDGRYLLKAMSNPLGINEIRKLTGARAATPLPPPPPAGPQSVQRRVPKSGQIMVADQRIRVSPTPAGTIVTIVTIIVDDHHLRVLDGLKELCLHARTSSKPVRNFNAHRPH